MTMEENTVEELAPGPNAVDITPSKDGGVLKEVNKEGCGDATPPNGCKVTVHYEGRLTDSSIFDSSKERSPFSFNLGKGNVIKAWDIGVATMKKGEVSTFFCREDYAYGKNGSPPKIPPGATLVFEVEMIDWEAEDLSSKKDKGILRYPIETGTGQDNPTEGSTVEVHLVGECDGKVFDERDVSFSLGEGSEEMIPLGVEKALEKFSLKEKSKLELKPQYGFGPTGSAKFGIPADSALTYTVTLKSFEKIKDSWMLDSKEKLEHARMFKEKGTNYFKLEKYQLALKMYKKMVVYLEFDTGFDDELEPERKSQLLAGHLNISICYLKIGNCLAAKNQCDKALEQDSKNVKALFRRGQAYLGLNEPDSAKRDFEAVLAVDPENKAAASQISVCQTKIREIHGKEKQIYSNMFGKFGQKKEWRHGWWDKDRPVVQTLPEDPEKLEEKKREAERKRKLLEEQNKLILERRKAVEEAKAKAEAEQVKDAAKTDEGAQDIAEEKLDQSEGCLEAKKMPEESKTEGEHIAVVEQKQQIEVKHT